MSNQKQYIFTVRIDVDEDTMSMQYKVDSFFTNDMYQYSPFSYQDLVAMEEFKFLDEEKENIKKSYESISMMINGIQMRMRFNPDIKGIFAVLVDEDIDFTCDHLNYLISSKTPEEQKQFLKDAKIKF